MFNSVELFSGCGGLTLGMKRAGFKTRVAVELDENAVKTFKLNHKQTEVICDDLRKIKSSKISSYLNGERLHFLAGCPPCQGFSSIRRLNRKKNVRDPRNNLILEYLRVVEDLNPLTIMMENVPGLKDYYLFKKMVSRLKKLGYYLNIDIVNIKDYGVPQNRKRLVMLGSLLGEVKIASPAGPRRTVRGAIGRLKSPEFSNDPIHKIFAQHTPYIRDMIAEIPKDGGGRHDLPEKYKLECHKKENIGFNDVYGRLRWRDFSTTITGGCLNPSKGRFLHPEDNRAITAREAALLQTFPQSYKFSEELTKTSLALQIGNALPPKFSYVQSRAVFEHLELHRESFA